MWKAVFFKLRGKTCHGGGRCKTDKFLPGGTIVMDKIIPGGRFVMESISHATPAVANKSELEVCL